MLLFLFVGATHFVEGCSVCLESGSKCLLLYVFVDVNECLAEPCANQGTCINSNGSYSCVCVEGWQGMHCDEGEFIDVVVG